VLKDPSSPDYIIVKLADFGFAKIDAGDLSTPCFTVRYASAEV
jgi:hypothetical protein